MGKKLYRSDDNKIIFGVCGGIGEYFDVDPVIIRLILIVLVCIGFSGLIAYIVAALVIPKKPVGSNSAGGSGEGPKESPSDNRPGVVKAYEGTYTVEKEE